MSNASGSGSEQSAEISDQDVSDYLRAIDDTNVLGRSARRRVLLEYLIRQELDGEGENLKAYSIGLDVFDKPDGFDPSVDSSVRVEIGRLRERITLFEASEDATTALQVEIPLGTYRPQITRRAVRDTWSPPPETGRSHPVDPFKGRRRMVATLAATVAAVGLIIVLLNNYAKLFGDHPSDDDYHPIVLMVEQFKGGELANEIAFLVKESFSNSSIVELAVSPPNRPREGHFDLKGTVVTYQNFTRVSAELVDLANDRIVWTKTFSLSREQDLQSEINQKLNGELGTRLFGAAKRLLEKYDPHELTPQQLFVLATWVSGPAENSLAWETKRVDLMNIALEKDPMFGPAHSVLADKYGFLANVYPTWDTPDSLRLSRFHAERAAELSPLDPNVMFNVAQSYWHAGRHRESQLVFQRVTELDSGNSLARFFAKVVPYWCAEVPDETMEWAIAFDRALSADDPIRWIVLTWIASMHTNRGEYKLALAAISEATQIFQVGYTYMAHAMLLNKLGRPDAAAAVIRKQRDNWPLIGAKRYGASTIPRLCLEQPNPERFISYYTELTSAMEAVLEPPD